MIKKITVLLMIGVVYQCSSSKGTEDGIVKIESIPVRAVQINSETYNSYHNGTGTLASMKTVRLIFEIPGRIEHVFKNTGDLVKKGEIIAQLKNDIHMAQFEFAQTAFEKAERDLKNSESLHKQSAISEDNLLQAKLGKKKAEVDLVLAKNALDNSALKAPFNGQISYINLNEGEYFSPTAMSEIPVIMSDINSLQVETTISAKFISQIHIGDHVEFSLNDNHSEQFYGFVYETGLIPIKMGNSYEISLSIVNPPEMLRLGMIIDYKIKIGSSKNAFLLPNKYILEDKQESFIHILKEKRAQRKMVHVIKSDGDRSLIKENFPTGILLITDGTRKVTDGSLVRIVE